jgi:hypothetical protein
MKYIYIFFQGKSTFFAFMFFSVGSALAFLGKLTAEYAALATGVQLLLVTRSVMDDYHERNKPRVLQNVQQDLGKVHALISSLIGNAGSAPAPAEDKTDATL